ncbi:hypothetical protein J437_LFUL008329 [Ladona fulva]|uniref:Uncharacterized protein n=1 Tax=Ladona fulva TaxID=123851 RepID=A0A8K0K6K2_LADFU|nr:hypothetical protein J437_LFUL008329 [Ladona fulva]
MSKKCARCDKTVYPIEELKCLDKKERRMTAGSWTNGLPSGNRSRALGDVWDSLEPHPSEDMAQVVLQMPGVQHDPQYEDLQGIQQAAILRSVSMLASTFPSSIKQIKCVPKSP